MKKPEIKNRPKAKGKKGFSLMEMMIAVFIFFLVTVTTVAVFAQTFTARRNTRKIQRDLENTRTALDSMAKAIRMSNLLEPGSASAARITMYNTTLECISYRFNSVNGKLEQSEPVSGDPTSCAGASYSYHPMTEANITGSFYVNPTVTASGSEHVGKATIRAKVGNKETLQTTVSFRDYEGTVQ